MASNLTVVQDPYHVQDESGDIVGFMRSDGVVKYYIVAETNPVTGGIGFLVAGKEAGARLGAASVTYDTQGRVATHDGWTMTYDSAGRADYQTKGTQIQTFNYDSAGRFTGITEA